MLRCQAGNTRKPRNEVWQHLSGFKEARASPSSTAQGSSNWQPPFGSAPPGEHSPQWSATSRGGVQNNQSAGGRKVRDSFMFVSPQTEEIKLCYYFSHRPTLALRCLQATEVLPHTHSPGHIPTPGRAPEPPLGGLLQYITQFLTKWSVTKWKTGLKNKLLQRKCW